jgi:ADP-ribosylglycohydrolase
MKKCLDENQAMFDGKNFGEFGNWLKLIEKSFESLEVLEKELPITKAAGWARIAFSYAVHFAVKSGEFKKHIEYLISAKGDTDTNACIAGGLLGVKLGLKGMEQMADQMENIRKWRPQKKMRPNWMVPGMVIDSIGEFMCGKSPKELAMVGS